MSLPPILGLQADDLKLLLVAQCHLGSKNVNAKMKKYIFSRREDGIHIMHLGLLWEKLVLAARIIVAVENTRDVCIVSSGLNNRRSALKFAEYVGTTCFIDRYIPGTLTNTTVQGYTEPLLLISTDPYTDAQVIRESQYCNMPVIALADSHNSLENVDVAIPCNNVSRYSVGVITWLLARTVLRLRGSLSYGTPWDVPVDMFFYLDDNPEETEQQTTQTGKDWKEQPSWVTNDWKGSSSAFEPQSSLNDKVLWSDDNADWMNPTSGPTQDFKEFVKASAGPRNWADDEVESNTGGWDAPTTTTTKVDSGGWDAPTTAAKVDSGGWDSPVFQDSTHQQASVAPQQEEATGWDLPAFQDSTNQQASAPPQQEEATGWGAPTNEDDASG